MHRFDSEQDAKNFLSNLKCCFALGDVPKCHEVYDIRGKIINERGTIYSYIEDDCTKYVALVEMEDERRNSFIQEQTKNPRR